jgi:hypothetical protein
LFAAAAALLIALDPARAFAAPMALQRLEATDLSRSAAGRQLLRYVVGCALPAGSALTVGRGQRRQVFRGEIGLASEWTARALTLTEQRRVSACLLARTNRHGRHVRISMRMAAPDAPSGLQAAMVSASERRQYPFHEGTFFGNLFADAAQGYVCAGGPPSPARTRHLRSLHRVCSLLADGAAADGARATMCGQRSVGVCAAPAFVQDGIDYLTDAIEVYLPAPARRATTR